MGIVKGSKESAVPFYVCIDTVYLRYDIQLVKSLENEEVNGIDEMQTEVYQYHEIQCTLSEWLEFITDFTIDTGTISFDTDLLTKVAEENTPKENGIAAMSETNIDRDITNAIKKSIKVTPRFTVRRN